MRLSHTRGITMNPEQNAILSFEEKNILSFVLGEWKVCDLADILDSDEETILALREKLGLKNPEEL